MSVSLFTAHKAIAGYCDVHTMTNEQAETIEVYASDNAGAFYCEHAYCTNIALADRSPYVGRDAEGHKLVGFLHIAPDEHLFSPEGSYRLADRHSKVRAIAGAALKGYLFSLVKHFQGQKEFKILVSGYDRFHVPDQSGNRVEITNNPSQDFVKNQENLDAAMAIAFGRDQVKVPSDNPSISKYVVKVGQSEIELQILGVVLPVNDTALNVNLPRAVGLFRPNAILSTGVGGLFTAELKATNSGLGIGVDGQLFHDPNAHATYEVVNPSLWNAIQRNSIKP